MLSDKDFLTVLQKPVLSFVVFILYLDSTYVEINNPTNINVYSQWSDNLYEATTIISLDSNWTYIININSKAPNKRAIYTCHSIIATSLFYYMNDIMASVHVFFRNYPQPHWLNGNNFFLQRYNIRINAIKLTPVQDKLFYLDVTLTTHDGRWR